MIDNIEQKIRDFAIRKNRNALTFDELVKIAYDYLNKVVRNNDPKKMQYISDDLRQILSDFGLYQDPETGNLTHSAEKENYVRGQFEGILGAKEQYIQFLSYIIKRDNVEFNFQLEFDRWLNRKSKEEKNDAKEKKYISHKDTFEELPKPLPDEH